MYLSWNNKETWGQFRTRIIASCRTVVWIDQITPHQSKSPFYIREEPHLSTGPSKSWQNLVLHRSCFKRELLFPSSSFSTSSLSSSHPSPHSPLPPSCPSSSSPAASPSTPSIVEHQLILSGAAFSPPSPRLWTPSQQRTVAQVETFSCPPWSSTSSSFSQPS